MVLRSFDEIIARNRERPAKVMAVAAACDEHTLAAVIQARDENIIIPKLVGDKEGILEILNEMSAAVPEEDIIDEPDVDLAAAKAVALVRTGEADLLMKGKLNTANMLKAIIDRDAGIVPDGNTISLMAMAQIPSYHKLLVMTDGGICRNPDLAQKKCIIENAVSVLRNLGYACPKVAVMAAVENVNPKMVETVDAAELQKMNRDGEITGCLVEGPLSMDMATDAEMAALKGYEGKIAGDPDILVWPNVVTGNLVGKALVRFAGATTVSFAVGAKCPLVITSRAASAYVKHLTILTAANAVPVKR